MEKIILHKDGKKCEVRMKETSKGFKVTTKGNGCKGVLGKDNFESFEIQEGD